MGVGQGKAMSNGLAVHIMCFTYCNDLAVGSWYVIVVCVCLCVFCVFVKVHMNGGNGKHTRVEEFDISTFLNLMSHCLHFRKFAKPQLFTPVNILTCMHAHTHTHTCACLPVCSWMCVCAGDQREEQDDALGWLPGGEEGFRVVPGANQRAWPGSGNTLTQLFTLAIWPVRNLVNYSLSFHCIFPSSRIQTSVLLWTSLEKIGWRAKRRAMWRAMRRAMRRRRARYSRTCRSSRSFWVWNNRY